MSRLNPGGFLHLVGLVALAGGAACGSGGGGTTGGTGGSGGMSGSGGAPGAGGATGSGGAVVVGDGGASCDARSNFTLGIHVILDVSWPDTIGGNAGTGKLDLWNLAKLTAAAATPATDGFTLSGTTQPCGSTLPELTLKPIIGGGKLSLQVPNSAWDAAMAPKASSTGTIAGWSPGSALKTDVINVLAGLTLPDPVGPWPASHNMVTAVDSDGDGQPGITAVPTAGAGYVMPPVETPILGLGAKADKVDLASRTALSLSGMVTSCTQQSGTVSVKFFDSRVVGCHVSGGAACTAAQVDFIDMNSTPYTIVGGTFTSMVLADDATCADARAALGGTR